MPRLCMPTITSQNNKTRLEKQVSLTTHQLETTTFSTIYTINNTSSLYHYAYNHSNNHHEYLFECSLCEQMSFDAR